MSEYKLGDTDLSDEQLPPMYKKGFEHGYWLKRGNSKELDDVIKGSKNHKEYHSGLKAGKKEAIRESVRARMQSNGQEQEQGIDID